jgi:hypothetical protein
MYLQVAIYTQVTQFVDIETCIYVMIGCVQCRNNRLFLNPVLKRMLRIIRGEDMFNIDRVFESFLGGRGIFRFCLEIFYFNLMLVATLWIVSILWLRD